MTRGDLPLRMAPAPAVSLPVPAPTDGLPGGE